MLFDQVSGLTGHRSELGLGQDLFKELDEVVIRDLPGFVFLISTVCRQTTLVLFIVLSVGHMLDPEHVLQLFVMCKLVGLFLVLGDLDDLAVGLRTLVVVAVIHFCDDVLLHS